jgi:hypothetical protein
MPEFRVQWILTWVLTSFIEHNILTKWIMELNSWQAGTEHEVAALLFQRTSGERSKSGWLHITSATRRTTRNGKFTKFTGERCTYLAAGCGGLLVFFSLPFLPAAASAGAWPQLKTLTFRPRPAAAPERTLAFRPRPAAALGWWRRRRLDGGLATHSREAPSGAWSLLVFVWYRVGAWWGSVEAQVAERLARRTACRALATLWKTEAVALT